MTAYADLRHWDPAAVGRAGEQLRTDLLRLERASDTVRARAVPGSWLGLAEIAARARQASLTSLMERHLEGAGGFLRAVFGAEAGVAAVRDGVLEVEHDAAAQEFAIGADGAVTDVAGPRPALDGAAAPAYAAQRAATRDALASRVTALLALADEVDALLVAALPDDAFGTGAPQGVADPRVVQAWAGLTEDERRGILTEMAAELADGYGLDVEVLIEDLEDQNGDGVDDEPHLDSRGFYRDSDRSLHVDENDLADPDTINTVAHEIRHALQQEMVRDSDPPAWQDALIAAGLMDDPWDPPAGITREDAEDWAENFEHYVSASVDFAAYQAQPVEADARAAGDAYLAQLTPEELERLRQEAS